MCLGVGGARPQMALISLVQRFVLLFVLIKLGERTGDALYDDL